MSLADLRTDRKSDLGSDLGQLVPLRRNVGEKKLVPILSKILATKSRIRQSREATAELYAGKPVTNLAVLGGRDMTPNGSESGERLLGKNPSSDADNQQGRTGRG